MGSKKLRGKDLKTIDFPSDVSKNAALQILKKHFKHETLENKLKIIQEVLIEPKLYLEDEVLKHLAYSICGKPKLKSDYQVHMLSHTGDFNIFGERHIAENAIQQMQMAMRLPISVKGALMPDAHHGYGLPIGAVLATENAVVPFGVGLDIGCRMALSIYDVKSTFLEKKADNFQRALRRYTHFGNEGTLDFEVKHPILDREEFKATGLLRHLHHKAWFQLGSSGTGNHFVEFGEVEIAENNHLGIKSGKYIGLLSHSGSRGLGASIASHFTKVAMEKCKLPNEIKSMAWLNMNEDAGQEYWLSMNLAGDYAKACHDVIHSNLERVLGLQPILKIENHHNFAWKENHDGRELIVHRKGATPAAEGQLGIIPGSMSSKGFIVSGKGETGSLNSASHGAGRQMSRRKARENISLQVLNENLKENGVKLIGGSVEECSNAYKNIETIIASQKELVHIEGSFLPKIVRMNKS